MPIEVECIVDGASVGIKDGELFCYKRGRKIRTLFTCAMCPLDGVIGDKPYQLGYR